MHVGEQEKRNGKKTKTRKQTGASKPDKLEITRNSEQGKDFCFVIYEHCFSFWLKIHGDENPDESFRQKDNKISPVVLPFFFSFLISSWLKIIFNKKITKIITVQDGWLIFFNLACDWQDNKTKKNPQRLQNNLK